ncbi:hypothetical protein [Actinomadura madurae]|uniref:hypothetical protein n=1 Tax=Actinomadura madurae TaxID=1993 RepID=UPI0020D2435C|nr:hypothetical protein [Actinomadura madurae]MCP9984725.1 hypothetical protein [Actinomadura madurae]
MREQQRLVDSLLVELPHPRARVLEILRDIGEVVRLRRLVVLPALPGGDMGGEAVLRDRLRVNVDPLIGRAREDPRESQLIPLHRQRQIALLRCDVIDPHPRVLEEMLVEIENHDLPQSTRRFADYH